MKKPTDLGKWLAKLWAPIAVILGAITAIVQFVQLWRGDQETITQVLWIGGIIIIWLSLYYMGFSKSEPSVKTFNVRGQEKESKPVYSYGEKLSKAGRMLFYLSLVGILALWGLSIRQNNLLNEKVVVLVANFDGASPENYRVTEQLLSQLTNSLLEYNDTLIIPLGKVITEQEGSTKAQELGKKYRADLVIWGWYGVTESDVLVTIHIENLSNLEYLPLQSSGLYDLQLPVFEIKSFQVQQRLSSQMTAITFFLGGLIRYEAEDYPGAIDRLTKAVNEQWPEDLLSRKFVFFYRGLSYFEAVYENIYSFEEGYGKAIVDFSVVIKSDPAFWQAYYFRTLSYVYLDDYLNAQKDYQLYIAQAPSPTSTEDYKRLAYLAMTIGDFSTAIEYFTEVITNDPTDSISILNRGQAYYAEDEYKLALEDLDHAIELEPKFSLFYTVRAEIYQHIGEYDLALSDLNRALDLFPTNEDPTPTSYIYYGRGRIYATTGDYQKAVEEFSKAIELYSHADFYYSRGLSYFESGSYENAIQDFSVFLNEVSVVPFTPGAYSHGSANDFDAPNGFYYRGVALENLGDIVYAFIDYETASLLFSQSYDSYKRQGLMEHANFTCERAIYVYQERAEKSENEMIRSFASSTVKSFQANCSNLDEPFPTGIWLLELIRNPIIPGVGMAGIRIGDSAELVTERLGNTFWFSTTRPNETNDVIFGMWSHESLILTVYFSYDDKKVIGFSLEATNTPPYSEYIPPLENDITLGSSENDLLKELGRPLLFFETPATLASCTDIYYSYNGIGFRMCNNDKLIHVIEIPNASR